MSDRKVPRRLDLWFERFMAIAATVNLGLVLFNLSYIHWRDLYLRSLPPIVRLYDPVKGIQPHRETDNYLAMVKSLEEQVSQTGLQSPQTAAKLEEVQQLSTEIIDTNPFASANKTGTLEKIKNRMRDRVSEESAKKAFAKFWSQPYLLKKGWNQEIEFFNSTIQPLIATNYYRQIGENGEPIDRFWLIDLPFTLLFSIELLGRSFFIKRRHPEFSWLEAILWRWYNLLLIIPFWRWLRAIPVFIRLDKSGIINLPSIRTQVNKGIVSNFAEELTEIVVVRVINQVQTSIKRGEITRWLSQKEAFRQYIDINDVNEVEALTTIFIQTVIYQVFPKVQPEIIAILQHNIDIALKQAPVYRNLQILPGVSQMQTQLSEQLATQIATNVYNAIVTVAEDPTSAKLSSQLMQRFTDTIGSEMQKKHVISEIQTLLFDFLEEMKLNYVQRLSQEDFEQIIEQTRRMKAQTKIQASAIVPKVRD
ncbi:MAG: hypothetical protein HC903_18935 [Methylacidiphilales bacterium]|nr:hypothetical protein [Candidatus Methylacidiphilales bacterium]NJR17656.1 hypothetical protein [Calothrix sp. CSU_2_0]